MSRGNRVFWALHEWFPKRIAGYEISMIAGGNGWRDFVRFPLTKEDKKNNQIRLEGVRMACFFVSSVV